MQPLPTYHEDTTFTYTQLEREGDIAIFCQEHKLSHVQRFEVVHIRVIRETTFPNGITTPAHEQYPGAHMWGTHGWTFFRLADAKDWVAQSKYEREEESNT